MNLSRQQRQILMALRVGYELTTLSCFSILHITTLSQRGGELERMGLVTRDHPTVPNSEGKPVKVVRLKLTDLGRNCAI
jgi:DNA-binding MarR family transcriptional regulator